VAPGVALVAPGVWRRAYVVIRWWFFWHIILSLSRSGGGLRRLRWESASARARCKKRLSCARVFSCARVVLRLVSLCSLFLFPPLSLSLSLLSVAAAAAAQKSLFLPPCLSFLPPPSSPSPQNPPSPSSLPSLPPSPPCLPPSSTFHARYLNSCGLSLSRSMYSRWIRSSMRRLTSFRSGLNMRCSCCTTSKTSCWCCSWRRDFMTRTTAASTACRRSLSTSSTTRLRSSTGGRGTRMRLRRSVKRGLAQNLSPRPMVLPSGCLSRICLLRGLLWVGWGWGVWS
jgi:hypothetical protein